MVSTVGVAKLQGGAEAVVPTVGVAKLQGGAEAVVSTVGVANLRGGAKLQGGAEAGCAHFAQNLLGMQILGWQPVLPTPGRIAVACLSQLGWSGDWGTEGQAWLCPSTPCHCGGALSLLR